MSLFNKNVPRAPFTINENNRPYYQNSMRYIYMYCPNLIGSPVCSDNIKDMSYSYHGCQKLTGFPVYSLNAINMISTYGDCINLTISPQDFTELDVKAPKLQNAYGIFEGCKIPFTLEECYNYEMTNFKGRYAGINNFKEQPICGDNVINMSDAYSGCFNLTGSPVCGPNVTDMYRAYYCCQNLTGSPVCGNKVENMSDAYYGCHNLTGSPICGDNVTDMNHAYGECWNLTGNPVCENNVIDMNTAYWNCKNLTGSPVCGSNVTGMYATYVNCYNLYGDMWMNYKGSKNASDVNAWCCFYNRNTQNRLNIHVPKGYAWDNWLFNDGGNLITTLWQDNNSAFTWTTMTNGYYNTAVNIYVYNNVQ